MAASHSAILMGAVALVVLAAPPTTAEEPEVRRPRLAFFPTGPGEGQHAVTVGGVWQVVPQFVATWRWGLPLGFTLGARIETIVIRNQLDFGATWCMKAGPVFLGPTLRVGGWLGFLSGFGFEAMAWGLVWEPGLVVGLPVAHDAWVTLTVEGYFNLYQAARLGSLLYVPGNRTTYLGLGASLTVEFEAFRGVVFFGAGLFHTSPNYPTWITFAYGNPNKYLYPSVLAGYEF